VIIIGHLQQHLKRVKKKKITEENASEQAGKNRLHVIRQYFFVYRKDKERKSPGLFPEDFFCESISIQ
jgi:hypothetical protein